MSSDNELLVQDVLSIGRVQEVRGRTVQILVDSTKNRAHLLLNGEVVQNVAVGGYVKIHKGFSRLIGQIDGETITERPSIEYASKSETFRRLLDVKIVGYLDERGVFKKGVRELPLIDNECFVLSREEYSSVHSFVEPDDLGLRIGVLPMHNEMPLEIGVDAFFASHIGIFGNTGSGKSYTLAQLYHSLLENFGRTTGFEANARILILDFNGEYVDTELESSVIVEQDIKRQYLLSTRRHDADRVPVSRDAIYDSAFWAVLLDATEKTQAPFLQRTLDSGFWDERLSDNESLSGEIARLLSKAVTDNDPQNKAVITKLVEELYICASAEDRLRVSEFAREIRTNLNYHTVGGAYQLRISNTELVYSDSGAARIEEFFANKMADLDIDFEVVRDVPRVRLMIVLQYYSDVINGYANREHLGPLIKRLERRAPRIERLIYVDDESSLLSAPLTVVSLRDVEIDMKKVIPLLLCKQLYEDQKRPDAALEYLGLVIDEAHNILSTASSRESETWKDYRLETFEEIVKEGRKFGVFLTIASQRPYDISSTITSQLHNYFLHRLVNSLDIDAIEHAVSYLDKVSFESLSILPVGTCIVSGVSTQVPVVVAVDSLERRFAPNSATPRLTKTWS